MIVYYVHLGKKIEYQLIIYTILELVKNLRINKINFYKTLKKKHNIHLQVHYTPTYKYLIFI